MNPAIVRPSNYRWTMIIAWGLASLNSFLVRLHHTQPTGTLANLDPAVVICMPSDGYEAPQ